jgi:Ca-activated chloride channel family protein
MSFSFANPWVLPLLLLIPLYMYWTRRDRRTALVFSRTGMLGWLSGRGAARVARLPGWLRGATIAALVIALAAPRTGASVVDVDAEGIAIVIALDISSSMLAEDFAPRNRLSVAKEKVAQFIAGRQYDRIGLVAFAGEALTQVPITIDYAVIHQALEQLQAGTQMLEDGTAIGTAIATAANRLKDAPGNSRVMIVLTDGVNNRGNIDPRTAARAGAALGIRIYTIGVGTEGMAPVPVGRGLFGLRYEMRPVEIDDQLLTEVARLTGGRYFRARDAAALDRITREIDRLERVPVQTRTYVRFTELYRWPLILALLALAGEIVLFARRGPLPA